jgi:hypothetical protein
MWIFNIFGLTKILRSNDMPKFFSYNNITKEVVECDSKDKANYVLAEWVRQAGYEWDDSTKVGYVVTEYDTVETMKMFFTQKPNKVPRGW